MMGLELDDVRVIAPFVGGGFGGKGSHPQALEAVRIAKLAGKPVMVAYNREEQFFTDHFRSAAVVKIKSGVTSAGKMTLWNYKLHFFESRGSDIIYNVPNALRVSLNNRRGSPVHPLPTGAWRAPGSNTNTFARESQIDIMAARTGIDPVRFRLNNLTDEKMIRVIETLVDKFGYKSAKSPSGRGIGMACGTDAGTWVAVMLEIELDRKTGKIHTRRIVAAQDMGLCVNPEGATIQMEGCVTMGLGYALSEDIRFRGGMVFDKNFDTYHIPLFSWVPESIETVILGSHEEPPQGGGEPAIICMGAAMANAIFDATGARIFRQPMTPERVLEALRNN
jgi:isoquinoline 1-oxidoreductase